jgi:glycolate oxidase FAD binding subunit
MDYGRLFGAEAGGATIGGAIAVNASGPRRIKAGAARDHLLGFRCVTGRGELVKSGGRVMKNVTGYDLSKLVCGSYGTLALLTELTLKVLPKPQTECTLLVIGADEAESLALLRRATATPCEPSALAMLPAGAALALDADAAAIRLEGPAISVTARRDDLVARLASGGLRFETLDEHDSAALWRGLRDAAPVAAKVGQIWRISVAPSEGFAVVERIRRTGAPVLAHFYDWAGGLIWLRLETAPDAHAAVVRGVVDACGGHATLIRASAETRATVDVFHPQPAALAALTRRVKASFDPAHVLERGRMRAEF